MEPARVKLGLGSLAWNDPIRAEKPGLMFSIEPGKMTNCHPCYGLLLQPPNLVSQNKCPGWPLHLFCHQHHPINQTDKVLFTPIASP
ncbi:unnamed protein product [Ixodes persulcatus]